MNKFEIVVVDDHELLANALCKLINRTNEFHVIQQFRNGQELLDYIKNNGKSDLILLDVNMPVMGGEEVMKWIQLNDPKRKVLILTMKDDDQLILSMIKKGALGYLLKDINPKEFIKALHQVLLSGFYYTPKINKLLLQLATQDNNTDKSNNLNDKELTFIKLACTELTYKEIAAKMFVSPKTIDGYRDSLFRRLKIKNRVGLVIFAIKNKIVNIEYEG